MHKKTFISIEGCAHRHFHPLRDVAQQVLIIQRADGKAVVCSDRIDGREGP